MSSIEFTEWQAFWMLEAELSGAVERPPTTDELGDKLRAWAAQQNAKQAGKMTREPR